MLNTTIFADATPDLSTYTSDNVFGGLRVMKGPAAKKQLERVRAARARQKP